jgi:hypothetical protein
MLTLVVLSFVPPVLCLLVALFCGVLLTAERGADACSD